MRISLDLSIKMNGVKTPNIVFIIFDTMRKDAITPYGANARTYAFSYLAEKGVYLDNVVSTSNWTIPSHASFFTGMYPHEHKVHEGNVLDKKSYSSILKRDPFNLPEIMKRKGYFNVGISSNPIVSRLTGFANGFDEFHETYTINLMELKEKVVSIIGRDKYVGRYETFIKLLREGRIKDILKLMEMQHEFNKKFSELMRKGYPLDKGGSTVLAKINEIKLSKPFFLFINLMEMHEPYLIPDDIRFGRRNLIKQYDNQTLTSEIKRILENKIPSASYVQKLNVSYRRASTYSDELLSSVIKMIREKGVYDDTIFIATSDHGQSLYENNFFSHAIFLHDEIIHLPLIMSNVNLIKNSQANNRYEYIQNMDIYSLIKTISDGEKEAAIGREFALSESYSYLGDARNFMEAFPSQTEQIDYLNSPRKALFLEGFKIVVNSMDSKIDEFSRNGKKLDPKDHKQQVDKMLDKINEMKGQDAFYVNQ